MIALKLWNLSARNISASGRVDFVWSLSTLVGAAVRFVKLLTIFRFNRVQFESYFADIAGLVFFQR